MEAWSASDLPPGFGFHPTDVELISHYLKRKVLGHKIDREVIPEIDIYKHEPWDLPARCRVPTRDSKWHFFAARDKKYPNGLRSNRATEAGYWKSTGKDRSIRHDNRVIGTKKTLVFHQGRPPCGRRSDWIMHEFYINESECRAAPDRKDAFVLCRVTKRNGWEVASVNVEQVHSEKIDEKDCVEQPQEVASSAAPEKSSTPSESVEDIDAWFAELFDPNFTGEVKNEPEDGATSSALKEEPNDPYTPAEISEDWGLLFPVEDFCSILQSDTQSYDVFGQHDMGNMEAFGHQQVDMVPDLHNNEYIPTDENLWSGIHVRKRPAKPYIAPTDQKSRLQVNQMQSRNEETLSGTIRVNQILRMSSFIEEPLPATSTLAPRDVSISASGKSARTRSSCLRGLVKSLSGAFASCSSAGKNCFFLFACVMGTVALLVCFLLRDARRFFGSFSALEL